MGAERSRLEMIAGLVAEESGDVEAGGKCVVNLRKEGGDVVETVRDEDIRWIEEEERLGVLRVGARGFEKDRTGTFFHEAIP